MTTEISGSTEWFNNNNNNNNNINNNNNNNINNNNNTSNTSNNNNNGGTFLSPLPVLTNSSTGLNKSIDWLYSNSASDHAHSINTSSNKVTKLSNGFSLLIHQDGTQSPSCFLNLSSTSGNHDDPVQVPMNINHHDNNNNNNNTNMIFQYNISPQLQSQQQQQQQQITLNSIQQQLNNLNNQNNQQTPQQQLNGSNGSSNGSIGYSSPISPVPQYSTSSAGSSPIQEYPYFPPSSPIQQSVNNNNNNNNNNIKITTTPNFQFSSLKATTGIAPPSLQQTNTTDFSMLYNFVQQNNNNNNNYQVKTEDSLINQLNNNNNNSNNNTTTQPTIIQNPFLPYNSSTPVSVPTQSVTILSSANSSTNSSPNNNNSINYNQFIGISSNNNNNTNNMNNNLNNNNNNNNTMDFDEDKPFSQEKFLSHLKSIIPSFNENYDASSESSAQSESSQESDYDMTNERNNNTKKRGREEDKIDTSGQTILSRDSVLKLTSKEIEEYVSRLKMHHVLTQAEEKELKKQRRLVKNREYASQSRSRRKIYVENIESKLQKTNQDCASIKSQLNSVKEENKQLKKQLYSLTNTLKSNPSLAEAFGKIFQPIGNNKTSSATLFVFFFLFTFSFLFQNPFSSPATVTFNSDSVSSIQRNLLGLEDNIALADPEWNIKKAILEETKIYVDSLLASIYTNTNTKLKTLSETPFDTSSFMATTTTTTTTTTSSKNNESNSDSTTVNSKISSNDDEISNVLSDLSFSDKEVNTKIVDCKKDSSSLKCEGESI